MSCPACGQQGCVAWEKGERPGTPDRLQDLSAGFVAVETSAKQAPRILCAACRIPAETP